MEEGVFVTVLTVSNFELVLPVLRRQRRTKKEHWSTEKHRLCVYSVMNMDAYKEKNAGKT